MRRPARDVGTFSLELDLSRITGSFVISRNTAFTYRNKPVDTKQIGRELGVRDVLEGSVRRSANKVRVNAQLIDAETDAHLWADQFDGDMGDLFALQNEITSRIAIALNVELSRREAARPTENPDALDYILRGRAAYWKPNSREKFAETTGLFDMPWRSIRIPSRRLITGRWRSPLSQSEKKLLPKGELPHTCRPIPERCCRAWADRPPI